MAHIKNDKKIAKYRVLKPEAKDAAGAQPKEPAKAQDNVIWMHEKLERPEVLIGSTYKIQTPGCDPKGGYWQPGGKFMPSTIAELGYVIERHLQSIGLLKKPELDVHQRKLVQEKRAEFEARTKQTDAFSKSHFPEGAQLCAKCSTAAVVMMDGCNTCLNCGDSKCG